MVRWPLTLDFEQYRRSIYLIFNTQNGCIDFECDSKKGQFIPRVVGDELKYSRENSGSPILGSADDTAKIIINIVSNKR